MKPTEINLERTRGDTAPIGYNLKEKGSSKGLVLTGNTFIMSVSDEENPTGNTYVFQSTGVILDEFKGKISFPISTLQADNLGVKYYDVQVTAGSIITTIIKGKMEFLQDITK